MNIYLNRELAAAILALISDKPVHGELITLTTDHLTVAELAALPGTSDAHTFARNRAADLVNGLIEKLITETTK